ncbi:putative Molybdopterin molybdenumtransferase [Burkholderiales bacterium]|nr:putative Molybdopterin molybdenumtransferase [Burkholderiales bacterium]
MSECDLTQAFACLAAGLAPITQVQQVALADAPGRVLARPLVARRDLPSQDTAAMDGYAVRAQELAQGRRVLRVVGRVLAGHPFAGQLLPGTCARIMTGASMPEGSDAVVVMEVAEAVAPDLVALPGPVAAGANRRVRGEHVRAGETVLPARRRLRTTDLALACAIGEVELGVLRRLEVGILSTGDELRDPPADLPPGCAYDSNRLMLRVALEKASMAGHDLGICPDDLLALQRVIDRAFEQRLDALLISGGAALGDADVVRMLDGVEFVSVDFRPGRGIAVARLVLGSQTLLVLGLPGNAVAAYVLFHTLALPVLARLAGADAQPPLPVSLPIAHDVYARAGRIDFRRARLVLDASGRRVADPLSEQGSAMIRSVSDADALVAVGPAAQYRAGDLLPTYLVEAFESLP